MGFSVPAAMGAALGRPDKETWAITGDGGFQMTFQELMSARPGARSRSRSRCSTIRSWG